MTYQYPVNIQVKDLHSANKCQLLFRGRHMASKKIVMVNVAKIPIN